MKHEKTKSSVESRFNKDIIEILQKEVDSLNDKNYKHDECKPEFNISILNENDEKIILSIHHLHRRFSRVVFPRDDCYYGYESLEEILIDLYNQTM